ncbi:hypothetical protein RND71_023806 [Anisodus tanguticus]|uniref:Protein NLRC3 n=1 Tax=Anisodus tanguticus TaxID=243964 RepID=A0AAE1VBX9_9SOLA|nr:hypothetical protein RND71_023806 [Anisodus tanguticus]
MGSPSTLSLCSHPTVNFEFNRRKIGYGRQQSLSSSSSYCLLRISPVYISRRRNCLQLRHVIVGAASSSTGPTRSTSSRRVYKESLAQSPAVPVEQITSFVVPAGAFVLNRSASRNCDKINEIANGNFDILALVFSPCQVSGTVKALVFGVGANIDGFSVLEDTGRVVWKLVEKVLLPKPAKTPSEESKPTQGQGVKWSIAAGTNLLPGFGAKIERESKLKLNDFAKELRSFSIVDMSGRNFGDEGLFFLAESLAYNQTAEEVNFAANGITVDGLKAFDGILQKNIALKTLNLSGNAIGDEGAKCLCDILANNSGIQKLQLNSTGLGDEGAKAIGLAGSLLENKTLQSLHLNGNYGGALGAAALAKGLESNKSLRGNSVGDEGVRALISGLSLRKGKLVLLDLANNSVTARGAFHVAEYVKKSKSLLWLNLYMNDIKDEGAEKIAEALKENRSITNVDLGGNDIHAKGISAIAEVLKDNSVITSLELGYNPIGPEGAMTLAEVLKFHGNVKDLMLGWCQIGPKGAEYFAEMLKYNSTISTLDLRANGLRDEGAICFARSLRVVNEALTTLNLGFNEIRDEGAFSIAQALKANEDVRLTSLNLASNFLTKLGQTALTDARDHVFEMTDKELAVMF